MNIGDFYAELTASSSGAGKSGNAVFIEACVPQSQVLVWLNGGGRRYAENAKRYSALSKGRPSTNPCRDRIGD